MPWLARAGWLICRCYCHTLCVLCVCCSRSPQLVRCIERINFIWRKIYEMKSPAKSGNIYYLIYFPWNWPVWCVEVWMKSKSNVAHRNNCDETPNQIWRAFKWIVLVYHIPRRVTWKCLRRFVSLLNRKYRSMDWAPWVAQLFKPLNYEEVLMIVIKWLMVNR